MEDLDHTQEVLELEGQDRIQEVLELEVPVPTLVVKDHILVDKAHILEVKDLTLEATQELEDQVQLSLC